MTPSSNPTDPLATARALLPSVARPVHLVDDLLKDLGMDQETRAAALLRQGIAKGALTIEQMEGIDADIVRLVAQLEPLGSIRVHSDWAPGSGLAANQSESLRRMFLAVVSDPRLVIVRLVEQLVALREAKNASEVEKRELAVATREIFAPLANRLGVWQLKWEMEDLAFRYLEPDRYREIARTLNERRMDREAYITQVTAEIQELLSKASIKAQVRGRPKHIYSIWKKMQRKDVAFDRLFDIRAIRILVDTVADCYAALGIVHGKWRYLEGEFDDYIANPKENDYQSLHTAVIGPEGAPMEVQIRTFDMHKQAELGVAAHWRYKEGGKSTAGLEERVRWLRNLLEPLDSGETPDDFLDRLKAEILEERVYVFSPKGDVVDLPFKSTPLDFAYHVHTEIGHRCRGAKVNGRMVPLTYQLTNGDQVEILTAKQASPSRDWLVSRLGYLASGKSRAKVRAWFRQRDRDSNRRHGKNLLEKELVKLGARDVSLADLASRLKQPNVEALCVAIGAGDLGLSAVTGALKNSESGSPRKRPRAPRNPTAKATTTVAGLHELMSHFARCCRPVPPEPIVGYVTRGRGVAIHRAACANARRLSESSPDRIMELDWGGADEVTYPAEVTVLAYDRQGLLRDLTSTLADEEVSILATRSTNNSKELTATINLTLAINSLEQLSRVLDRLRQVPNVVDARRQ